MSPIHLLHCLCGGQAQLKWETVGYFVECDDCELSTGHSPNHSFVVNLWNSVEREKIKILKKRKSRMESAEVTTRLPFILTSTEVEEQAQRATQLMSQLDNMEEDYKLIKRDWNKKIKDIKLSVRKACQIFASKIEEREVNAQACYDLDTGRTWHEYGGKQYLEREMSDEERQSVKQGTLFEDGANIPGVQSQA